MPITLQDHLKTFFNIAPIDITLASCDHRGLKNIANALAYICHNYIEEKCALSLRGSSGFSALIKREARVHFEVPDNIALTRFFREALAGSWHGTPITR